MTLICYCCCYSSRMTRDLKFCLHVNKVISIFSYISYVTMDYQLITPSLLNADNCYISLRIASNSSSTYVFEFFFHPVLGYTQNQYLLVCLLIIRIIQCCSIQKVKDLCFLGIMLFQLNVAVTLQELHMLILTQEYFFVRIFYNFVKICLFFREATRTY